MSANSLCAQEKRDTTKVGLGGKVVNELVQSVKSKNHCVLWTTFFQRTTVSTTLNEKTYACGRIRSNRKQLPNDLMSFMKKGLSARGDCFR